MSGNSWVDDIAERLGESDEERDERLEEEGLEDGKNADWGDRIAQNTFGTGDDAYDEAFQEALDADDEE